MSLAVVRSEYLPASPETDVTDTIRHESSKRQVLPWETFVSVCADIAEHGQVTKAIADHDSDQRAFYRWTVASDEAARMYTRAKALGCHAIADQTMQIQDERPPMVVGPKGASMDMAYVTWQKNRVETRKWHLSKLMPRIYGDKLELAGNEANPLTIRISQDDDKL